MTALPIYLDYNATTPIDPAVRDAMLPYLGGLPGQGDFGHFGNPSSSHAYGKTAHEAVEIARRQVAELLSARPEEIVFTGGGSEASNLCSRASYSKNCAASSVARRAGAPHHQHHRASGHAATVRISEIVRLQNHAGGR